MTDQDLLTELQYPLMEAPDGGATFPSGLWTRQELLDRANERQNRFLKTTNLLVGSADIPAVAGQTRFTLPQDWLGTIELVWTGQDGTIVEVPRGDVFQADHGMPGWAQEPGTPALYMEEDAPTLELQIAPPPLVSGVFTLLYVPQGAPLTGDGEVLTVPEEYAYAVGKYGVLADAFAKDGRGKNPSKATYCALRYQLAQETARILLGGWV